MRRVNGYEPNIQRFQTLGNRIFLRALLGIEYSKVSNLKMADEDTETNIFGDGVENRGVDDDDEIGMRNLGPYDSSSRRGSEDTTYRSSHSRTYGETSFIEGIDEHTPLITKESKRNEAWDEIRRKFPKVITSKFTATLDDIGRVFVQLIRTNSKYSPLFNKDGEHYSDWVCTAVMSNDVMKDLRG